MAEKTDSALFGTSPAIARRSAHENIRKALEAEASKINGNAKSGVSAHVELGYRGYRIVLIPNSKIRQSDTPL